VRVPCAVQGEDEQVSFERERGTGKEGLEAWRKRER
jgi:hypothetical protein